MTPVKPRIRPSICSRPWGATEPFYDVVLDHAPGSKLLRDVWTRLSRAMAFHLAREVWETQTMAYNEVVASYMRPGTLASPSPDLERAGFSSPIKPLTRAEYAALVCARDYGVSGALSEWPVLFSALSKLYPLVVGTDRGVNVRNLAVEALDRFPASLYSSTNLTRQEGK